MSRRRRHRPDDLQEAGTPPVVLILLAINVAVHVGWQLWGLKSEAGAALMASHFMVSLQAVTSGYVWTLVTSAFSHMAVQHLLFNMLALWVFGREVALVIGQGRFLHLYLVGGVLASVGHLLFQAFAGVDVPALGASGSVMAIAVVYAALFPRRTLLINFFIPVPAALAVLAYVVIDMVGALSPVSSGVAHAAHLGGAAYGLLYYALFVRPRLRRAR